MKYNKKLFVGIFIILVLNLLLVYEIYNLKWEQVSPNAEIINQVEINNKLIKRIVTDATIINSFKLSDTIVVQDVFGNSRFLKDIFENKDNLLFFRFSPIINCNSCIVEAFLHLKFYLNEYGDKIILLVSDSNTQGLQIILNKYNIQAQIFIINDTAFPANLEKFKDPYFYVMEDNLIAKNIFFVQYGMTDLTPYYLDEIFNILL